MASSADMRRWTLRCQHPSGGCSTWCQHPSGASEIGICLEADPTKAIGELLGGASVSAVAVVYLGKAVVYLSGAIRYSFRCHPILFQVPSDTQGVRPDAASLFALAGRAQEWQRTCVSPELDDACRRVLQRNAEPASTSGRGESSYTLANSPVQRTLIRIRTHAAHTHVSRYSSPRPGRTRQLRMIWAERMHVPLATAASDVAIESSGLHTSSPPLEQRGR